MKLLDLYVSAITYLNREKGVADFSVTDAISDSLLKLFSISGMKSLREVVPSIDLVGMSDSNKNSVPELISIQPFDIDDIYRLKGSLHKAMCSKRVALSTKNHNDTQNKVGVSARTLFRGGALKELNQLLPEAYKKFKFVSKEVSESANETLDYLIELERQLDRISKAEESDQNENSLAKFKEIFEQFSNFNKLFVDSSFAKHLITPENLVILKKMIGVRSQTSSTLATALKSSEFFSESYDKIFIQNTHESLVLAIGVLKQAAENLLSVATTVHRITEEKYKFWTFCCLTLHKLSFDSTGIADNFVFNRDVEIPLLLKKLTKIFDGIFEDSATEIEGEEQDLPEKQSYAAIDQLEETVIDVAREKFIEALRSGKAISKEDFESMYFIHEFSLFDKTLKEFTSGMAKCKEDIDGGLSLMRSAVLTVVKDFSSGSTQEVSIALKEAKEFIVAGLLERQESK